VFLGHFLFPCNNGHHSATSFTSMLPRVAFE
jgi:hypothetical protein